MSANLGLAERRSRLEAAREALSGLDEVLHQASGAELDELTTLVDEVSARAGGARAVVTAEVVRRGEYSTTTRAWVRSHAPSLQQGGAGQLAQLAALVAKADSSLDGSAGVDPETPLGIVWDAVTTGSVAPAGGDEVDGAQAGAEGPVERGRGLLTPITATLGLAVLCEMRVLQRRLVPEAVATVTRVLVALGREWGAAHMRRMRPLLLATYGLQGELDEVQEKLGAGAFLSSPEVESGELTSYRMALTPEQAATLEAALGPLSKPQPNDQTGEADLRPAGQRRAEALIEICRRVIGAVSESDTHSAEGAAGSWAALHLTMTLGDLRALTGCVEASRGSAYSTAPGSSFSAVPDPARADSARADSTRADSARGDSTRADSARGDSARGDSARGDSARGDSARADSALVDPACSDAGRSGAGLSGARGHGEVVGSVADGVILSPQMLRRIACGADLIPHVLGSAGELLDQGRVIRTFNRAQRRRLWLRDRHCTFPGCDVPASWSRAHHVTHWFDGGVSDVSNGALLCQRHHTIVHQRRLCAEVLSRPDEDGRYVVWDLTVGSYDRMLETERTHRADHDPPPLTQDRIVELLGRQAAPDTSGDEARWLERELAWAEPPACCNDPACICQLPLDVIEQLEAS